MPKYLYLINILKNIVKINEVLNLRYRGGKSSIGLNISKLIISELLNSKHTSKWRIGNNIKQCSLCGRCEIVCNSRAIAVNRHKKTWMLNNGQCNHCLQCIASCPMQCLTQVRL